MGINLLGKYNLVIVLWASFILMPTFLFSQEKNTGEVYGVVRTNTNEKLSFCLVYFLDNEKYATQTNEKGEYTIKNIPFGDYTLVYQFLGFEKKNKKFSLNKSKLKLNIILKEKIADLAEFQVTSEKEGFGTMSRMRAIEGVMISEGKKNEVIQLAEIDANKATNQGRQIYSRIPGLNIWESDGAGIQLGIGGRGLDPNRTSNFNTRQNGYDISADALGYPESYYTPPAEAIQEIQLIRGAASLQFGTQFGGLLNLKLHDGPVDKDFEVNYRMTLGSFNLKNTFMSVGFKQGTWKGYGYFQLIKGN
jgi:Fe(3+) dicitrate transport protein